MVFGKLVHIVTGRQRQGRRFQRHHGKLHHGLARDELGEQTQFERVHHILGVVQNEDLVGFAAETFLPKDSFQNGVEAVPLAGGAGSRVGGDADSGVHGGGAGNGGACVRVIGVNAHENRVIVIIQSFQQFGQHCADDGALAPGGDQDGGLSALHARQIGHRHGTIAAHDHQPAVQLAEMMADIQPAVVQAGKEKEAGDQDKNYPQAEMHIGE